MKHFNHAHTVLDVGDIDDIDVSWHNDRMRVQLENTLANSIVLTFNSSDTVTKFVSALLDAQARHLTMKWTVARAATPGEEDAA
jgi:AAA15 family ATPase/GTPase